MQRVLDRALIPELYNSETECVIRFCDGLMARTDSEEMASPRVQPEESGCLFSIHQLETGHDDLFLFSVRSTKGPSSESGGIEINRHL